jgi:uncharacterized SAM-binding protein YcdF (DUF218 family)
MFFFFSKVLGFLTMPFTWAMSLLLWSWITKKPVRKKRLFIAGMLVLLVFSNRFLHNQVMMAWEVEAVEEPAPGTYDAIIVLGGFSTYNEKFDRINFANSSDRFMQGLQLVKKGVAPLMIVSGGSGSITYADHLEGDRVKTYLQKIGFPDSLYMVESQSKNTYENAVETAKILKEKYPDGKFLLVTSGYHMRRSLGCFAKQGLNCDPYSVDMHGGEGRGSIDYFLVPDIQVLNEWNLLFHEWLGCLTYSINGYL